LCDRPGTTGSQCRYETSLHKRRFAHTRRADDYHQRAALHCGQKAIRIMSPTEEYIVVTLVEWRQWPVRARGDEAQDILPC
jgi:hypothetical protein